MEELADVPGTATISRQIPWRLTSVIFNPAVRTCRSVRRLMLGPIKRRVGGLSRSKRVPRILLLGRTCSYSSTCPPVLVTRRTSCGPRTGSPTRAEDTGGSDRVEAGVRESQLLHITLVQLSRDSQPIDTRPSPLEHLRGEVHARQIHPGRVVPKIRPGADADLQHPSTSRTDSLLPRRDARLGDARPAHRAGSRSGLSVEARISSTLLYLRTNRDVRPGQ